MASAVANIPLNLTHFDFSVDDDGVAMVLMDVPGASTNALSEAIAQDLRQIIHRLESDPGIIAAVIGSKKPNSFIVGRISTCSPR